MDITIVDHIPTSSGGARAYYYQGNIFQPLSYLNKKSMEYVRKKIRLWCYKHKDMILWDRGHPDYKNLVEQANRQVLTKARGAGTPHPKGGVADPNLLSLVQGGPAKIGGGTAKLTDFVDNFFGKESRTFMGDVPEGGYPVVIDVWSARDAGFIDPRELRRLTKIHGDKALKNAKVDIAPTATAGSAPTPQQYEVASRFYLDLTDKLNEMKFLGGGLLPEQVQAIGWNAMRRLHGEAGGSPADIIQANTRRISFETTSFSPGSEFEGLFEEAFQTMPTHLREQISADIGQEVRRITSEITGLTGEFPPMHGLGGFSEPGGPLFTTPDVQMTVLSSPETAMDIARITRVLLDQSEVWVTRPSANKTFTHLDESVKTQNMVSISSKTGLDNTEDINIFWNAVKDELPSFKYKTGGKEQTYHVSGFQQVDTDNGKGIMMILDKTDGVPESRITKFVNEQLIPHLEKHAPELDGIKVGTGKIELRKVGATENEDTIGEITQTFGQDISDTIISGHRAKLKERIQERVDQAKQLQGIFASNAGLEEAVKIGPEAGVKTTKELGTFERLNLPPPTAGQLPLPAAQPLSRADALVRDLQTP